MNRFHFRRAIYFSTLNLIAFLSVIAQNDIKNNLDQETLERLRVEKKRYYKALDEGTKESYTRFIELYPAGTFSEDVNLRLNDIASFELAENSMSKDSFEDYINNSELLLFEELANKGLKISSDTIFSPLSIEEKRMLYYLEVANIYEDQYNIVKAVEYFNRAKSLLKEYFTINDLSKNLRIIYAETILNLFNVYDNYDELFYLYDNVNTEAVLDLILEYADEGNSRSQIVLGRYFDRGGELKKTREWYLKAAESGDPEGQCKYAQSLSHSKIGYSKPEDYNFEEALKWLKKSSEQGFADANYEIACFYMLGLGVEKSAEMVKKHLSIAVSQGSVKAKLLLGYLYLKGELISQNTEKSYLLFKDAAEKGDREAEFNLAGLYVMGEGVEQDYQTAANLLKTSSLKGSKEAQCQLAQFYLEGKGVDKDLEEAFYWFNESAKRWEPKAIEALKKLGVEF